MIQFRIQPESDIPASTQLYNQIHFAIASRQYPPGHRLPSTRQLAQITGLHRNTISKVYRQLEEDGVVDSQAGSGIYVRAQGGDEGIVEQKPTILSQHPEAHKLVRQNLDEMVKQGYSLHQVREMVLAEVDWRLRCSASVLVTAMAEDMGIGELMVRQLQESLNIPVQLVPLEELDSVLAQTKTVTVVTTTYFIRHAEAIATPHSVRVIPLEIYDYADELQMIRQMPKGACLGLVSMSAGFLRAAEVIIYSLRGEDLLIMTAQPKDTYRLNSIVRSAHTILTADDASLVVVKAAIQSAREDLIRPPRVVNCQNYISTQSISLLKRELGLE
jgi:GntR family transcriptional regulator